MFTKASRSLSSSSAMRVRGRFVVELITRGLPWRYFGCPGLELNGAPQGHHCGHMSLGIGGRAPSHGRLRQTGGSPSVEASGPDLRPLLRAEVGIAAG
jgi:hypothetical protein